MVQGLPPDTAATPSRGLSRSARKLLLSLGLCVSVASLWLGRIWPSLFTLLAIPLLPSPLFFLWMMFVGKWEEHRAIRLYLLFCGVLGTAMLAGQGYWLATTATIDWSWLQGSN
jgi:hypothetical protein